MALKWYTVVIDCLDAHAQARWWAEVLDWTVAYEAPDEVVLVPRHALEQAARAPDLETWMRRGQGLVFVPVPEGKQVKNRLHLDLAPYASQDRDAEIQRLLEMGASRVDVGQDQDEVTWTVLADPEGNEFCVLSSRDQ
ncbi:VOC family protein [Ornithinimicrobium cryptoxanthini]|uniref:VOC family protein n=1 Tax=Ornithinimicrobium cryptoxanthini TaxID=2934161 RepID=A0ABY4YJ96_9MICO|nr:VOC family protein [Ornithinimicrobium cryptoxanthini]USQ76769.1 VOC family protein [Ornithinimicrobium cryptoxanthini]